MCNIHALGASEGKEKENERIFKRKDENFS